MTVIGSTQTKRTGPQLVALGLPWINWFDRLVNIGRGFRAN